MTRLVDHSKSIKRTILFHRFPSNPSTTIQPGAFDLGLNHGGMLRDCENCRNPGLRQG